MRHVNTSKAQAAADALDIADLYALTLDGLGVAYRAASKTCHPDSAKHDPRRWSEISHAKETLTHWLAAREKAKAGVLTPKGDCRACAGVGYTQLRSGGFGQGARMRCVLCEGTGQQKRNDRDE